MTTTKRTLRHFSLLLALTAAAAAAMACSGGQGSGTSTPVDEEVSREEALVSLADGVFVPAYQQAAAAAHRLAAAAEALQSASAPETLAAARDAWKETRLAWSRTLAFDYGPADKRRSMSLVDWVPVDTQGIENLLAERDEFSAEDVTEFLPSSQRGLGAIEHVLFAPESDEQTLERLQADGGRRIRFVVGNAQAIAAELDAVALGWTQETADGPAYRDVLTGRAPVSLFVNGAVAEVVRSPVFLLQTVGDMQLAPAVGLRGGGADLSGMPSVPSGLSAADIRSRLLSVRDVYAGADSGAGLSDLVAQMSADTDARMTLALDQAVAAAEAITLPMDRAAVETPEAVRSLFDRVKDAQRVLNTEVVSLLGVSVGFSDNDGDSSN